MPFFRRRPPRTRGAVFSMDQLIIAGAFRLWSTARGVTSIHAGSHQTTQPTRAGNIAAGVKPADTRDRLASRRTQPSASSRRANKDSPSGTREDHNYLSYHPHAFRHTSSWLAPRAGTPSSGQAYTRTSPSGTTGTRHRKGSGTKAPQPRVARRRRGATLGILNLLGSGYEFQGWHFSKERGWQSLTRVCRTHHKLLRSFGVMRHAQPASARSRTPGPHIAFGSWTLAGQQHHSSTDLH